jgi:deoxyribonuclease IV
MSVAGGLHLAFSRLAEIRGEALQIFTKSERQWRARVLEPELVRLFIHHWQATGSVPVAAHDTYLINLAAIDSIIMEKSVAAFAEEMQRAELLRIPFLITHPGSHLGQGIEAGLANFVRNMDRAVRISSTSDVVVLIEITAGQGTNLGSCFEEIAFILNESSYHNRLGVCFDTCHAFAAGYDLRTAEAYTKTFGEFDRVIGLNRIKFFHLNDSKKGLGSRVDRHEHIGKGSIGLEAFRLLLNDPRFSAHPMVLETPRGKDLQNDIENLKTLRSLLADKYCYQNREVG